MTCRGRTLSFLVGLCLVYVSLTQGQSCDVGKYGYKCQHDCHCNSTVICDPESGCGGGDCAIGWDGITCQRRNVALNRSAIQFPGADSNNARRAVDGIWGNQIYEYTTCTAAFGDVNNVRPRWSVQLDGPYNIHRVIIYNRKDCCPFRLSGFVMSVRLATNTGSPNYTECYKDSTPLSDNPGDVINITCTSGPIRGDSVQIELRRGAILTLCEVVVYVCSDGWYGEMCDIECRTNDTCLRCDNNQLRCEECTLGKWGTRCGTRCGECYAERQCDMMTGVCPKTTHDLFRCAAGYRENNCGQVCAPGTYGEDCLNSCGHCVVGLQSCATDSGICPNAPERCDVGFKGDRCKENCTSEEYGPDCKERCGNCVLRCDVDTGMCPGSPPCMPGYTGGFCNTKCENGLYGSECLMACGACKGGNSTCNHIDGHCPSCMPGWRGDLCNQACNGTWGENCKTPCSEKCRLGPMACDRYNGTCVGGCLDGFVGPLCLPDINECEKGSVELCGRNSLCFNISGTRECRCSHGHTSPTGDGTNCKPISDNLAVGVGIGFASATLLVGGLVVFVAILQRLRKRRLKKKQHANGNTIPPLDGGTSSTQIQETSMRDYESLAIPPNDERSVYESI